MLATLSKMIVTRDPKGRLEDRCYICTDPELEISEIALFFSRRWSAEVMHKDCKQFLGLDEIQNGWWRRTKEKQAKKRVLGAKPKRGMQAASRTFPFVMLVYGLIVLWYLEHGHPETDVSRVRRLCPWYRHKKEPCFADMLFSARRNIFDALNFEGPSSHKGSTKFQDDLMELMMAS
jgi:hypothetical protein